MPRVDNLPKVIQEAAYKFQFEKMTLWEERLRLVIKPKPRWCPKWLYQKAINLVFQQQQENVRGGSK